MKVLIVSHNPVSGQSNMGKTLQALFSAFSPEELCQLYIYPTVPDEKFCGSYYRITDKEALRAVFTRQAPGGEMKCIAPGSGNFEHAGDVRLYRNPRNKRAQRALLRDAIWKMTPWFSAQLQQWLEQQAPQVLFVAPGGAKLLYDLALRIAQDRRIPVVTYLCDEFYFQDMPTGGLEKLRLRLLQRKMKALMASSAQLVTISHKLEAAYAARFSLPVCTVMTGAGIPAAKQPHEVVSPVNISYFGNIRCNRYLSLSHIGRELDAVNEEMGTDYGLKIYTAEQDKGILAALQQHKSIQLCGFLQGDAFVQALQSAQLLLHVEAFDEESRKRVKHSISTKIADSLASGVPLLAFGPEEVASMEYLREQNCAMCATSPEELRETLLSAFTDAELREAVARNGLDTARIYHDSKANSLNMRTIFEECL